MFVPPGSSDGNQQIHAIRFSGSNGRIVNNDVRGGGTQGLITLEGGAAESTIIRDNLADGLAFGEVTLAPGAEPTARVETGIEHASATLDLCATAASDPDGTFSFDHRFECDGSAWTIVFEWVTDPGEPVNIEYIVDQPQAAPELDFSEEPE